MKIGKTKLCSNAINSKLQKFLSHKPGRNKVVLEMLSFEYTVFYFSERTRLQKTCEIVKNLMPRVATQVDLPALNWISGKSRTGNSSNRNPSS